MDIQNVRMSGENVEQSSASVNLISTMDACEDSTNTIDIFDKAAEHIEIETSNICSTQELNEEINVELPETIELSDDETQNAIEEGSFQGELNKGK